MSCAPGSENNIFKMFILSRRIYRFNTIPVKILMAFSSEIENFILNFIWNEGTLNSQDNLEKKWEVSHFLISKRNKSIAIKTV